jgi:hypothetical protein
MDHDMVFFIGDFNYRIDESIDTNDVFESAINMQLDQLISKDQVCAPPARASPAHLPSLTAACRSLMCGS